VYAAPASKGFFSGIIAKPPAGKSEEVSASKCVGRDAIQGRRGTMRSGLRVVPLADSLSREGEAGGSFRVALAQPVLFSIRRSSGGTGSASASSDPQVNRVGPRWHHTRIRCGPRTTYRAPCWGSPAGVLSRTKHLVEVSFQERPCRVLHRDHIPVHMMAHMVERKDHKPLRGFLNRTSNLIHSRSAQSPLRPAQALYRLASSLQTSPAQATSNYHGDFEPHNSTPLPTMCKFNG
jgi:hypothetical protein